MSTEKRLTRSQTDKMLGGVCGGLGEYFDIDPTLVRIAFAGLVLIGVGSPILLYLLLWIIMPGQTTHPALEESDWRASQALPAQSDVLEETAAVAGAAQTQETPTAAADQPLPERTPTAEA